MGHYTYLQLQERVGKNHKYYDGSSWITGADLTQEDIQDFINEIYLLEVAPKFQVQYPHIFRQTAQADSWISTGTAGAGLSGSTLTATTSIFTNAMVGLWVYNDTEDEKTKITGYTSDTEVTVENSDISDWSGDTVYVLGQEFAIGGDATDIISVESVGVKMQSSDSYFKKAKERVKEDYIQSGYETISKTNPLYYLTSVDVNGTATTAIGILPQFEEKISNAIEIDYVARPDALSSDTDKTILPNDSAIISGATMRGFEKRQDSQRASYWRGVYQQDIRTMLSTYRPRGNMRIRPARKYGRMARKII